VIEVKFLAQTGGEPEVFCTVQEPATECLLNMIQVPLVVVIPHEYFVQKGLGKLDPDDLADRIARAFGDWADETPLLVEEAEAVPPPAEGPWPKVPEGFGVAESKE
jgi:hypothetical protein